MASAYINQNKISIVAPVLNEEEAVDKFYVRMKRVLEGLNSYHEIIFIDDGSADFTLGKIKALRNRDEKVKVISFSRNFGHAYAITAGLEYATGDAVLVIDADLQDPPEVLGDFFKKWREGYDIIYGIRKKRKEWFGKRMAYWLFYRLLRLLSPLKIPIDAGDFALMDRKVVLVINALPERNRYVRGLRSWAGFKQVGVEYERGERVAGKTKYHFGKLLQLAADGIFSFSYVPLRMVTVLGFLTASFAFLAVLAILYLRLAYGIIGVAGFSSTMIALLFLGGVQLISTGILGEYVARIYEETKHRPFYIIKEKIGL